MFLTPFKNCRKNILAQVDWPKPGRDRAETLLQESFDLETGGMHLQTLRIHKLHKAENLERGPSELALPSAYTSLRIASQNTYEHSVHSKTKRTKL